MLDLGVSPWLLRSFCSVFSGLSKVEQLDKQMDEQKNLHSILSAQIRRQDAELKNSQRNLTNVKRDCEAGRSFKLWPPEKGHRSSKFMKI